MEIESQEYTKLSIHNHFGGDDADCKIDKKVSYKPCFDLDLGYEGLLQAKRNGFSLVAQTNSNNLDAAAYLLMRSRAKMLGIELLPGVEINLLNWADDKRVLHTVVVFAPSCNVLKIQEDMRSSFKTNGRFVMTIEQLCELLQGRRALLYFHGVKQDKRSMSQNGDMAEEVLSLGHFLPVAIEENRSFHKLTLMEKLKSFITERQYEWLNAKAAIMSAADRKDFSDVESPTYIWASNTFDDLYYCVLTGSSRITREEDIIERVSYISKIMIDGGKGMVESEVDCSQGLNCIVGPSGSGKTLLLDIIRNKLNGGHLERSSSSTGTYDALYDIEQVHLLDGEGNEVDASEEFEIIEGSNLYDRVIKAYSSDKSELVAELGIDVNPMAYDVLIHEFSRKAADYLRCMSEVRKQREKASACLAQAKSAVRFIAANSIVRKDVISYNRDSSVEADIKSLGDRIAQFAQDASAARKHFGALEEIAKRDGLSDELINQLHALRKQFIGELLVRKSEASVEYDRKRVVRGRQDLLFKACQEYNGLISQRFSHVNEKEQVLRDQLDKLATSLLEGRRRQFEASVPVLKAESVRDSIVSSNSNDAARLSVASVDLTIDRDELHERFPENISQRVARGKVPKSKFEQKYDLEDEASVKNLLDTVAQNIGHSEARLNLPMDVAVHYSVELQAEDGQFRPIDTFSAGELSKVYVLHFLDKTIENAGSNTIVLYDQPESNMEKEFLLITLVDKLMKLRTRHQIFVATHEPLLVVNADANELILASNNKRVGQTNQVGYENRSFVGAHGKAELIEEVAKLIDGGTSAVRHRSDVYEGMIER